MTTASIERAPALLESDRDGRTWLTFPGRTTPDDLVSALLRGGWRWSGDQEAWCTLRRSALPPGCVAWVRSDSLTAAAHPSREPRPRGSERKRAARRLFGALRKVARDADHPGRGDAELQRQLARLEREMHLLERRISRGRLTRRHSATYELKQREVARLRATLIERCVLNPDGSPVQHGLKRGDVVTWKGGPFLVSRVARRFVSGFHVGGAADGWPNTRADRSWISGTVQTATPALLAAVDHREARACLAGDGVWRSLVAEGLR